MLSVDTPTKSANILIKTQLINEKFNKDVKCEQILIENVFDPTKASPPNDFMLKLFSRMNKFNNKHG
jgi:hypothetical protein